MINYFNELGYEVSQIEETVLAQASDNRLDESKVALVVTAIISVVMIGFIFFMSRSKMMQNVYNIGVYRALGAKKSKIISKYLLDSIILATFTAVLGFLLAYAFMCYADNYLPSLHVDAMYVWICVALLYALMIIASLLPISMLLRKTPIDILGKYDI